MGEVRPEYSSKTCVHPRVSTKTTSREAEWTHRWVCCRIDEDFPRRGSNSSRLFRVLREALPYRRKMPDCYGNPHPQIAYPHHVKCLNVIRAAFVSIPRVRARRTLAVPSYTGNRSTAPEWIPRRRQSGRGINRSGLTEGDPTRSLA